MTDIHSMTDSQLCEAISAARLDPGVIGFTLTDCYVVCDAGERYPLNWLSRENALGLFEEILAADDVEINVDESFHIITKSFGVSSACRFVRAIGELWLTMFGKEGKHATDKDSE